MNEPRAHPYLNGMEMRPYVWMLGGCAWFTAMSLFAGELGRSNCPWQLVAFARSGLAMLFAGLLAASRGTPLVWLRPRVLWVRSVAGSCSMLGTFYALTHMSASDVLSITNTFPLWVALLAWPMVGERPTPGVMIAIGSAVVGVAVALQPGADGFRPLPSACAFVAAFFTAIAMLGLNRLRGVASLAIVVHFSAVSTLFALAAMLALPFEPSAIPCDGRSLLLLLGTGATATAGQVCLTRAFSTGAATKVSVVGLSQVVFVMVAEGLLGWKVFNGWNLIGTLLVIAPTAWLMSRARRGRSASSAATEADA